MLVSSRSAAGEWRVCVVGGVTCALVAGVASASVELVAIAARRSGRNSEDSWLTRSSSCLVTYHFRAAVVVRKYRGAHANSTRRYMHRLRKPGARVAERRQLQSHSKKLTCSTGALISHALDLTRQPSPQDGIQQSPLVPAPEQYGASIFAMESHKHCATT
jgi:hypothetical protein